MTAPVQQGAVAGLVRQLDTEMQFLLDGAGVPEEVQAKLAQCGVVSTSILAGIEVDVKDFREFVKAGLTIDPTTIPNKVVTAKLINAWEASVTRGRKRREEEAEQRIGDLPRKLQKTCHLELTKAFAKAHGEPKASEMPHPDYVEAKLQQLEDGMLLTETMKQIVSADDDDYEAAFDMMLRPDGKLRARRTATKKGSEPTTTEELRVKFRIVATMWELLRLRMPGKSYLLNYDMRMWDKYVEYLLGEKVHGIDTKSVVSEVDCAPPWALVLEYDLEFRKRFTWAFNNVEGTLETFMKFAHDDVTVYQVHFLNPLSIHISAEAAKKAARQSSGALGDAARARGNREQFYQLPRGSASIDQVTNGGSTGIAGWARTGSSGAPHGSAKAGAKGPKGKGKDSSTRANQICFKFQKGKCKDPKCERRHVCIHCDATDHGGKDCKQKKGDGKGARR